MSTLDEDRTPVITEKKVLAMSDVVEKVIVERNIRKILEDFSEDTSISGFGRIRKASSIIEKVIWLTFTFLSFGVFIFHFYGLYLQYARYPITVQLHYDEAFEWPSVTLCNLVPYSVSRMTKITSPEYHRTTAEEIAFYKALHASNTLEELMNKYGAGSAAEKKILVHRSINMTLVQHRPQDFILGCLYRGKKCSYQSFTPAYLPQFYRCYTFSPDTGISSDPDDDFFDVMMFIESGISPDWPENRVADYSPAGKIFFHQNGSYPKVSKILDISAGTWTMIGLDYEKLERIDTPVSPCKDYNEEITYTDIPETKEYYATSDRERCIDLVIQEKMIETCHCVSEKFRKFDFGHKYPSCHGFSAHDIVVFNRDISTITENNAEYQAILTRMHCHDKVIQDQFFKNDFIKKCPLPCLDKEWKVRVSPHVWPKFDQSLNATLNAYAQNAIDNHHMDVALYEGILNSTDQAKKMQFAQTHFLRLNIRPVSSTGTRAQQSLSYPLDSFMSEMGGILGMYLGMSIITIYELIHLLGEIIHFVTLKRQNKGKDQAKPVPKLTFGQRVAQGLDLKNKP